MTPSLRNLAGVFAALAAFLAFLWLGAVRRAEPFHTYLYFFCWAPFLLVLERGYALKTGRGFLAAMNRGTSLRSAVWLGVLSTTAWLFFEVFNFRLSNWSYIGVPRPAPVRWTGYALSFATVMPGVLFLASLFNPRELPRPPRAEPASLPTVPLAAAGGAMLLLPLIWPRYFFPLVWGGVFFLLEPYVASRGGRSLLGDWRARRFVLTKALLLSGLLCGLFWEACNWGAGAKWLYDVPFVGDLKIFEMPVLGFFGFPPFALELFVVYEAARLAWARLGRSGRIMAGLAIAVFWLLAFAGIDRFTVIAYR